MINHNLLINYKFNQIIYLFENYINFFIYKYIKRKVTNHCRNK